MKIFVVDTNAILRYLINDIPSQAEQTERLIKEALREQIKVVLPVVVVMELLFTLTKSYGWKKADICEKLLKLIASPLIEVEKREQLVEAINWYMKKNISFVDCLLISEAQVLGGEIFTFDKKLKKLMN